MQVRLALLADYANVTAEGKLNILGTFDHIAVSSFPAIHPQMQLILRFEARPAERDRSHTVQIRLHDPDGKVIFQIDGEIVPRGGAPAQSIATNQILGINNLRLETEGEHTFAIFVDNDLKAEVALTVTKVTGVTPTPRHFA